MPRVLTPTVITLVGIVIILLLTMLFIGSTVKKKNNGTIAPTQRIVSIMNSSGLYLAINFNPYVLDMKIAAFTGDEGEPNTQWRLGRVVGGGYHIQSAYIVPSFALKLGSSSTEELIPFPPGDNMGYCSLVPIGEATIFNIGENEFGTQFFTKERTSLFLSTALLPSPAPPQDFVRLFTKSVNDLLPESFVVKDSP